jgi:hypothetical protein
MEASTPVPLFTARPHLVVASEPINTGAEWLELGEGEAVGVDSTLHLVRRSLPGALRESASALPA